MNCDECNETRPKHEKWTRNGRTLCPVCFYNEVQRHGSQSEKDELMENF